MKKVFIKFFILISVRMIRIRTGPCIITSVTNFNCKDIDLIIKLQKVINGLLCPVPAIEIGDATQMVIKRGTKAKMAINAFILQVG